ncbi:hypothetical protein MRB53_036306 [Persea americana]|nr:hypothetical protein MRB53_036747 [Persea americana]KAJ8614893.1 hypothetical protein MRB53_036306 [Persea americana]
MEIPARERRRCLTAGGENPRKLRKAIFTRINGLNHALSSRTVGAELGEYCRSSILFEHPHFASSSSRSSAVHNTPHRDSDRRFALRSTIETQQRREKLHTHRENTNHHPRTMASKK